MSPASEENTCLSGSGGGAVMRDSTAGKTSCELREIWRDFQDV